MEEPDLQHFCSIPWCVAIITNPAYTVTPTPCRYVKAFNEDSLSGVTLKTPNTIPHCLSVYKNPPEGEAWIDEVRTLLTLGSGMNGGPNMLHGGMISTLFDEEMGTLLTINKDQNGSPLTGDTVTAELKVKYLRPVMTPGTVVVVARCKKREGGRKFWLEGWLEDEDGQVMARSEAFWVRIGQRL